MIKGEYEKAITTETSNESIPIRDKSLTGQGSLI